jgi:Clp amino terminal domain, pathogenicity island component
MFERFTDRARRVVILAQEEARRLNHDYIGTEHLLLGLIREPEGIAARALESLKISLPAVRENVDAAVTKGEQAASGHIPFTPEAKHVLELSLRESLQMGVNYIGTEHILLGLVREADGVGAQVLTGLGADLDGVRQRIIELLSAPSASGSARSASGPASSASGPASSGGGPPGPARPVNPDQPSARRARSRVFENPSSLAALSRRVTAVEQWTALKPDVTDLVEQLAQVRRDKEAALRRPDLMEAADLRQQEQSLLAERAARTQQRAAGLSLAEEVRQLREELERLRSLLREHGIEAGGAA